MRIVLALLAVLLLFPAMSFAEDDMSLTDRAKKVYLELKVGQYSPQGDLEDRNFPNGANVELTLGYRLFKYFALEVGYGYFKVEGTLETLYGYDPVYGNFTLNGYETVKVYPLLATGKFLLPFEDGFLYAGGGYGQYRISDVVKYKYKDSFGTERDTWRATETTTGWHYMLGTMLDVNDTFTIGLEYKEAKTKRAKLEGDFFGYDAWYKTDVDGRMISAFGQIRF